MAEDQAVLRIYCICGQKMKVTDAMFGRRGKCIACRQKIRIPREDEVPADVTEIYLRDHPEFLRKVKRRPAKDGAAQPEAAPPEKRAARPPGKGQRRVPETLPLDVLEPLRSLCSLQLKVRRLLAAIEEDASVEGVHDKSTLRSYRARLKAARDQLDEQLHQRLMEATIELSTTQEKIVQAGLAVRTQEMDFDAFRDAVNRLRHRRDHIERRKQNLHGWLEIADPHAAGGYRNPPLENVETLKARVVLPPEADESQPLAEIHIEALRAALGAREMAERRLAEANRLRDEGNLPPTELADMRADCKAEKRLAEARVKFIRGRLEQLEKDFANDGQSVDDLLNAAQGKFLAGEIDRLQSEKLQQDLIRAKTDITRARRHIGRALSAGSPQDVPYPGGSFLQRLAKPAAKAERTGVDTGIAWGVALVFLLSAFVPMFGPLSPLAAAREATTAAVIGGFVLPIAVAVVVAATTLIPARGLRGVVLAAAWFLATVVGAAVIHEAKYAVPLGFSTFWIAGPWPLRPAVVLFLLADVGLLGACVAAFWGFKGGRNFVLAAVVPALIVTVLIFTDFGGLLVAEPDLAIDTPARENEGAGGRSAVVTVANRGRRRLLLTSTLTKHPSGFLFVVQEQIGQNSWREVDLPWEALGAVGVGPELFVTVPPGSEREVALRVGPGGYRAVLDGPGRGIVLREETTVAPSEARPEREEFAPAEETDGASASDGADPRVRQQPAWATVELRGIMSTENRPPSFSVLVHLPDGGTRQRTLRIGDALYGDWTITEQNGIRETITISDGDRMLILRRGERVPLASSD
ncbi:MAG TPA: hypothetical protein HPP77_06170 [Candidatus Hydrogenedentes bacterium]|nr:hypothetical protein [Candidatus Hydrogenedentota bacterium]HIJ73214.1 hypothetical protein [Candidatus Hydrogenedentota bacterium]